MQPDGARRAETIMVSLLVLLISWHYFSTARAPVFYQEPDGYYGLQTEGFVQGHLHAAMEVHPALLALPDPYDPVANAPYRAHDMTLWQGKYYLYFGVAPILLLFLPVRVLTGWHVSEQTAVAVFLSVGLLFAALLLVGLRRRVWPQASPWLLLVLVAGMGLASPVVFLAQSAQFYQVPISCAYALGMAGLWCLGRFGMAEPAGRRRWLLAASVLFGLTLAARPNYILAMSLLLVPLAWCWREAGLWQAPWRKKVPLGLIAYGPVAVTGIGLLIYNWARFGRLTEFGMRYQLAGESFVAFTPLHWRHFWPHFQEYMAGKIWWQSYFPFMDLGPEAPYGVWRYLPLCWLGLVAFWPRRLPGESSPAIRWLLASVVALYALCNLVLNSLFFYAPQHRYMSDFAPALLLLGAMGGLTIAQALPRWRSAQVLVGIAAFCSILVTTGLFVYRLPAAAYPAAVAQWFNRGVGLIERMQGRQFGGIKLGVRLPAARDAAKVEPIYQTGFKADRRNWLQLHYLPKGKARLGFFHAGLGELLGDEFELPADGQLELDVFCSSFLPPDSHPFFEGWSAEAIAAARNKLEVRVGGRSVLSAALRCYPSSRWDLLLGRVGFMAGAENREFAGQVTLLAELPMVREELPPREVADIRSPLLLRLQMPVHLNHGFEPLVATGEPGNGDLLYVVYHPGHRVQFGLDSGGLGAVLSRPVQYDPTKVQDLIVWFGSWAPGGPADSGGGVAADELLSPKRLFVEFDGTTVLNAERRFNAGSRTTTALGWNRIGAGSASAVFNGRIVAMERAKPDVVPEWTNQGEYGAADLWVDWPTGRMGRTEPLVVTGEAGAGDLLYVKYVSETHVVFGHDHWGLGGVVSRPVRINFNKTSRVQISLGSMQRQRDGTWGRRLWLRVNDQQVFDQTAEFHPSRADQIVFGYNAIGSSTSDTEFGGQIVRMERSEEPR